jgi:two-component system OmpR family response regulator
MAVHVHRPRGGLKAHGLAVWVAPQEGQEIDDVVLARAAALVLGRALRIAPEAEVHWPAIGAVSSGGVARADETGVAVTSADVRHDDGAPAAPPSRGPVSHLAVDLAANEVLLDGKRVALSGFEFKLLRYLVENHSRAISREELRMFLESFDSPAAAVRSIDVYVGRVRRKLRRARHCIATVRNDGYQFLPGPTATIRGPAEYCI